MSTLFPVELTCPTCNTARIVDVADSVSASRAPWMREAILDRSFHRFHCARCSKANIVEKELLYTDFDRGQWIGMFPIADWERFEECGVLVSATFNEAMVEKAPKVLSTWAPQVHVRVTFGYEELREKLVCWEAGLDDRFLEALKLQLLWEETDLLRQGVVTFTLEFATDKWLMLMPVMRDSDHMPPMRGALIPREQYDRIVADRPERLEEFIQYWPGRPYVNLLRFRSHGKPAPGTPRSSVERKIWRDSR